MCDNLSGAFFEKSSGGFISRFSPIDFRLDYSTNVKDVRFQTITNVSETAYFGGYTTTLSTSLTCTPDGNLPICFDSNEDGFDNGGVYLMKMRSTQMKIEWSSLIPGRQDFQDSYPQYFFPNDGLLDQNNYIYSKTLRLASTPNGNIFGVSLNHFTESYTLPSSSLSSPMFYDDEYNGGAFGRTTDVSIFSINSNNNTFNWASLFGSDDNFPVGLNYSQNYDISSAIAISEGNDLYITGYSGKSNFNFPFENPGNPAWFQSSDILDPLEFNLDGYIAKFDLSEIALSIPPVIQDFAEGNITLYPNPSHDQFVIDFKDNNVSGVTIISIDGRVIESFEIKKNSKLFSVNSSNWVQGIYLVSVHSKTETFKTIKYIRN